MLYSFCVYRFGEYYPSLRSWTDPAKLSFMSRQYFFCRRLKYLPTEHYTFTTGEAFERFPLQRVGDEVKYVFRFGGDLTRSTATLRFKLKNVTEADGVGVFAISARSYAKNE